MPLNRTLSNQRIVQEAQQAISQREQTIASQEHTIRGLSQENSVMHQRLGDLERVVAHLTQQARATPVPIQESPPKAASIAETATESSVAKASSQGTVPPGTHQPVGAPQVSESQDASGVAASSQGNAFTSTIPDPPCGSVQSSGLGHDAPADSRDPGGGATSQHAGHSAVLGSVGDAAPGASRTSGLGRDGTRDQADVRVQVTALAEMVQQLSQLVANQVAPPPPPPAAPPPRRGAASAKSWQRHSCSASTNHNVGRVVLVIPTSAIGRKLRLVIRLRWR